MFISAERFMYQFVKSIKNKDTHKFKDIFRNADDWSGIPGNTINKSFVFPNLAAELWGPGSIEVNGDGSVENPSVVYTYKYDTCYDPQTNPDCPGYEEPVEVPEIPFSDPLEDQLVLDEINKLIKFHKKNKKLVTMSVVRPPARFGFVKLNGKKVTYFREKSKLDEGWINGGFFVMSPKVFDYIKSDNTFLERKPFEELSKNKQLLAYKHKGKWYCMDTKRDRDNLNKLFKLKKIAF